MTIEHATDGTKTFTSPEGVVTKHADFSAVLHYQATGQQAPWAHLLARHRRGAAPAGGKNAIDLYIERCRNVGRARALKAVGGA